MKMPTLAAHATLDQRPGPVVIHFMEATQNAYWVAQPVLDVVPACGGVVVVKGEEPRPVVGALA
ncbi:hypothetical protein [Paenarthrobacter nicotinovorans]|uniref:hypothetical protein n=1 Tax=Paenarthrobacter nicotinovorans TaxID=29320 RepID=UPI00286C378F|nr:hypothetical protein [Paenarthrobacter nicotinovorans]